MKQTNNWCMNYIETRKTGYASLEHIIVTAENRVQAVDFLHEFCERMNAKNNGNKYEPCDNRGYQMTIGGGCKW